jgi:hypothetical protein
LTNSSGELSLVFLSTKKTIYYVAIIKKLVERTSNVNIDIGFVLLGDIKYLINPDSILGLKSLRSSSKKEILAYTRCQD